MDKGLRPFTRKFVGRGDEFCSCSVNRCKCLTGKRLDRECMTDTKVKEASAEVDWHGRSG